MITISTGTRTTKIARREEAGKTLPGITEGFTREAGKITRVSSTAGQPYVAANYEEGTFIGGSTITQDQLSKLILAAARKGWAVEGEL